MELDGLDADEERLGDRARLPAGENQVEHFALAPRQRGDGRRRATARVAAAEIAPSTAASSSASSTGFCRKSHAPRFTARTAIGRSHATGDEHDRQRATVRG